MNSDGINRPEHSDVVFFSHLRWDFVFQRPQHIASRWGNDCRVYFWEEPLDDGFSPWLELRTRGPVTVLVPHIRRDDPDPAGTQRTLLDRWAERVRLDDPIGWYWTPMMRPFSRHLPFRTVVWDCMDELGAFAFAPQELRQREREMLADADVVFTGGHEIWRAKRHLHHNIHPMPSSVDCAHFGSARRTQVDPPDQAGLPHPRIGWFGVIDERTDLPLLDGVARAHPEWSFAMIGPVVKISPDSLPRRPNIHWLGMKSYEQLPAYIAHWDVAILPFARNDATRYISPTKTPEYLAAGRPVVSTPIADVIRPYGERGLVRIAEGVDDFGAAIAAALEEDPVPRRRAADAFLATISWDDTVARMQALVAQSGSALAGAAK
jgi:UDP-galactopyranose mutase